MKNCMKFVRGAILRRLAMLAIMMQAFLVASAYDFEVDGIYYNVVSLPDLTCEVTYGDNEYVGDIVIPSTVEYNSSKFTVVNIGAEAFKECESLTSVVISKGVSTIGKSAFERCYGLTSVVIPEGVSTIGKSAFKDCVDLTSVEFPESLTSIGEEAFSYCRCLSSVEFPASLTKIGEYAFYNCWSVKSLEFPASLTSIEENAFQGCNGLSYVKFEEGTQQVNLDDYVFVFCEELEQVILPILCKMGKNFYSEKNGVHDCFFYSKLKYLKVGSLGCNCSNHILFSLGTIETMELDNAVWGNCSFVPCKVENLIFSEKYSAEKPDLSGFNANYSLEFDFSELKKLVSKTLEPPLIPGEVPAKILMDAEVEVPIQALEKYRQAPVWKDFWNLKGVEGLVSIEETEMIAAEEVGRYDLTGKAVSEDYRGIVIVRYSDGTTSKTLQR